MNAKPCPSRNMLKFAGLHILWSCLSLLNSAHFQRGLGPVLGVVDAQATESKEAMIHVVRSSKNEF